MRSCTAKCGRCSVYWPGDLPSHGSEPPEGLLVWAERRICELNALLDPDQRQAVANVAVFGFIPQWFHTVRLELRPLPQDDRDRAAVLSGHDALAGVAIGKASGLTLIAEAHWLATVGLVDQNAAISQGVAVGY